MATLVMSDELIPLLADKLYENNPLPVLVRELLQNSLDAAVRKGAEPQIDLEITIDENGGCTVCCTDNGIGMTDAQISGDLLKVAGSHTYDKDKKSEIGGMMLAKLAIMAHRQWSVRTLNCWFDGGMCRSDEPIATNYPHVDGCQITVTLDKNPTKYDIIKAFNFVYFSNISIHLMYKNLKLDEKHEDTGAGMSRLPNSDKLKLDKQVSSDKGNSATCSLLPPVDDVFGFPLNAEGLYVHRVHGLVQQVREYGGKVCYVIDVETPFMPREPEYAFTPSRESFTDNELQQNIHVWIQKLIVDSRSTESRVSKPPPPVVEPKVYAGLCIGERNFSDGQKEQSLRTLRNMTPTALFKNCARGSGNSREVGDAYRVLLDEYYDYKKYYGEERTAHKRILDLWTRIVASTTNELCATGITGDYTQNACRRVHEYPYYLINPENLLEKVWDGLLETSEGVVSYLWHLACHEVAHKREHQHDECFTMEHSRVASSTADLFSDSGTYKRLKTDARHIVDLARRIVSDYA